MTKPEDRAHIMVVESRSHEGVADVLAAGAIGALEREGVLYERVFVPGPREAAAAIRYAIRTLDFNHDRQRFDGYVVLACATDEDLRREPDLLVGTNAAIQELVKAHTIATGGVVFRAKDVEDGLRAAAPGGEDLGGRAARAVLDMLALKGLFKLFPR